MHYHKSVFQRVTFQHVYARRPDNCRYAVVSTWDQNTCSRQYEVLDLFNVLKDGMNKLTPPAPRWINEDLNAAIMTTVLLYGTPQPCNNV